MDRQLGGPHDRDATAAMYGAALNEGRELFPSDNLFHEWMVSRQLAGTEDKATRTSVLGKWRVSQLGKDDVMAVGPCHNLIQRTAWTEQQPCVQHSTKAVSCSNRTIGSITGCGLPSWNTTDTLLTLPPRCGPQVISLGNLTKAKDFGAWKVASQVAGPTWDDAAAAMYGAALNEGRELFDGDREFGQWVAHHQLGGAYDLDRAAAMCSALNDGGDLFPKGDNKRFSEWVANTNLGFAVHCDDRASAMWASGNLSEYRESRQAHPRVRTVEQKVSATSIRQVS